MAVYKRDINVSATQFFEKEYIADTLKYPMVFDAAWHSALWINKSAEDGRYYMSNQTNNPRIEHITVSEGDYIVSEPFGIHYIVPRELFENTYIKIK